MTQSIRELMSLLELRVVLVMKPLLAELIRQVVVSRTASLGVHLSIVVELEGSRSIDAALRAPDRSVVIIGPLSGDSQQFVAPMGSRVRVLTLSADLTHVLGPRPGCLVPLTPDGLAKVLRDIALER
jgi:hypothetical protein